MGIRLVIQVLGYGKMGQISFVRSGTRRDRESYWQATGRVPECGNNGLDASGSCGNRREREQIQEMFRETNNVIK